MGMQGQMLPCLGPPSSDAKANSYSSPPASEGYCVTNVPSLSVLASPTVNLTREYTLVVHTLSYGEVRSKIRNYIQSKEDIELGHVEIYEDPDLLGQVLQPSHKHIKEALSHIRPNSFTELINSYFTHSEKTSHLCLLIYQSVHRARLIYTPLHKLLHVLPSDIGNGSHSMNQSQCDWTFDVLVEFDNVDNPFLSPDSNNFDEIRDCFSQLRQELDQHLHKSRSKAHFLRHATLVACPLCLPSTSKITKEELNHLSQLDAAAKGTYVLHNDLDTIDRLVARLHTAVDYDKLLIRLGLERGRDRHPIQEIVRQLRKNLPSFLNQLDDLEEHIFLCFAAINRARQLLLDEIYLHKEWGS